MKSTRKWVARLLMVGALGATAAVAVPAASSPTPVAMAQTNIGAGGEFHPFGPERVFDSRLSGGKPVASLAGSEFRVQIAGQNGLPQNPNEILAVVANVTVVEPEAAGWLAVRPSGTTETTLSALVNFAAGRNVPNLAWVGVGADGGITFKLRAANGSRAHVVVDVFGWISTSSATERGDRLFAAGPARLTDTRNNATALRTDQTLRVPIHGATSYSPTIVGVVPASATAVVVNIAAINNLPGSTSTYISATPQPVAPGTTSATANVNVVAGQIKTSMAVVPIGSDGSIYLRNNSGDIHVAVDVLGYFAPRLDSTTVGRVVPLDAPFRALDTREASFGNVPLGNTSAEDWSFNAFAGSVRIGGQPIGTQSALIGNLTGTDLNRIAPTVPAATYMTAYPAEVARPLVSNVNLAEGEVVPNMSLIRYGNAGSGSEAVKVYNHGGSVHYVLDVYAVVLS